MSRALTLSRLQKGGRIDIEIREGDRYTHRTPAAQGFTEPRPCRVEAIDESPLPRRAQIRYEDTGRIAMVPLTELVEIVANE